MDVRPGEELSFLYSRYGDLDPINLGIHKEIDELKEGSFRLIGATKKAPAYPYYSGDAGEPEGHQGWVERGLRFYMPLDAFEALIKSPDYKDTYGIHPEDTKANNYWDEKEILALIEDTRHLKEYQSLPSSKEDIEKIPMLTRSDMK